MKGTDRFLWSLISLTWLAGSSALAQEAAGPSAAVPFKSLKIVYRTSGQTADPNGKPIPLGEGIWTLYIDVVRGKFRSETKVQSPVAFSAFGVSSMDIVHLFDGEKSYMLQGDGKEAILRPPEIPPSKDEVLRTVVPDVSGGD